MNLRKTCHRAVSPKITPYSCVLICCHYRYMIALHSTLSLICGIVTLKQDVNFMALDKFEEITLYCASFLVRFYFFLSLRFIANRNWLPRHIKEELLSTPSPSAIFKCISLDIHRESSSFFTARAHKEMKQALANIIQKI